MQEFHSAELDHHKAVQDGLLEHIYKTYQPRDSTDVTPRVKAPETKVEAHGTTIGQHRGEINHLNGRNGPPRGGGAGGGG